LAAISLKVSAKLTRNKFKNITASYLLTSYIISSVKMLRMSNPVLFTMLETLGACLGAYADNKVNL